MEFKDRSVRHAVNTGAYYPIDKGALFQHVDSSLCSYIIPEDIFRRKIKAVLAPCLPYESAESLYSAAYAPLMDMNIDEVFIFSDSVLHKSDFVAFADYQYWEFPTGKFKTTHRLENITNSDDAIQDILKVDNTKHQGEISIECQLPFLFEILKNKEPRLIPFMIGDVSPRLLSTCIKKFIDPDDLLICVCNISRGIPGDFAEAADTTVIDIIKRLDLGCLEGDLPTVTAPNSLSFLCNLAKTKGWEPIVLDHSVVTISGHLVDSTVGAASILFVE